jgi:hypothetical protein
VVMVVVPSLGVQAAGMMKRAKAASTVVIVGLGPKECPAARSRERPLTWRS